MSRIYDYRNFNDTLVLHFGTEGHTINAETLAEALLGISNAIKIAEAKITLAQN